jgi:hypothetical protein
MCIWILLLAAIALGWFLRSLKDDPVDDVPPISPNRFLDWWLDGRPLRDD